MRKENSSLVSFNSSPCSSHDVVIGLSILRRTLPSPTVTEKCSDSDQIHCWNRVQIPASDSQHIVTPRTRVDPITSPSVLSQWPESRFTGRTLQSSEFPKVACTTTSHLPGDTAVPHAHVLRANRVPSGHVRNKLGRITAITSASRWCREKTGNGRVVFHFCFSPAFIGLSVSLAVF